MIDRFVGLQSIHPHSLNSPPGYSTPGGYRIPLGDWDQVVIQVLLKTRSSALMKGVPRLNYIVVSEDPNRIDMVSEGNDDWEKEEWDILLNLL